MEESTAAPYLLVAKSKSKGTGKERKGPRQLPAAAAIHEHQPGQCWAADEEQLFNTIPEVPTLVSSHVPRNSCARLRQRMCRRQCQERDVARCLESLNWLAGRRDRSLEHEGTKPGATQVLLSQEVQARVRKLVHERCSRTSAIPLPQAAFRELLGSHSVYGPGENGNLANFSTVELVSLPDSLSGCPRLCDVVPESLRHYLENIQSMIKSKAESENTQPQPAAYWDPVLKRNRAKIMELFCTFAGDWSSSASSVGDCEISSRNLRC